MENNINPIVDNLNKKFEDQKIEEEKQMNIGLGNPMVDPQINQLINQQANNISVPFESDESQIQIDNSYKNPNNLFNPPNNQKPNYESLWNVDEGRRFDTKSMDNFNNQNNNNNNFYNRRTPRPQRQQNQFNMNFVRKDEYPDIGEINMKEEAPSYNLNFEQQVPIKKLVNEYRLGLSETNPINLEVPRIEENGIKVENQAVNLFLEEKKPLSERKSEFEAVLFEKLRKQNFADLVEFSNDPGKFFTFLVPQKFLTLNLRTQLYKIKYGIQLDLKVNLPESQINRAAFDSLRESVKNNLPYFNELITFYQNTTYAEELKSFFKSIICYGDILINGNIILKSEKVKIGNYYFFNLATDPEFYFSLEPGKFKIFEKIDQKYTEIPNNLFTIEYLRETLIRRQKKKNNFIWQQYRENIKNGDYTFLN